MRIPAIFLAVVPVPSAWLPCWRSATGRSAAKKPRAPVQVLVVFTISSLLTLLTLALPARSPILRHEQETFNQFEDDFKNVKDASKWSAANRSLMKDLISRNQQYVSEISKLDETSTPLYTPQSFRDAATVQQMIDQLRTRLAVAEEYVDLEPVLSRMNGYVAAINASDQEKQEFLKSFASTVPATRAAHKVLTDKEQAWLQASLDLYQFALSKTSAYVYRNGTLLFQQRKDSDLFGQKLHKAQMLNAEFLKAYWGARRRSKPCSLSSARKAQPRTPHRPRIHSLAPPVSIPWTARRPPCRLQIGFKAYACPAVLPYFIRTERQTATRPQYPDAAVRPMQG